MAKIIRKKSLGEITDVQEIQTFLRDFNVTFDHWSIPSEARVYTEKQVLTDSEKESLLQTVENRFVYLKETMGYKTRDLVVLHPEVPGIDDMLAKFDKVHYHTDFEVRYIIDGSGIFGFVGENEKFLLHVEASDFISVPKNIKHWFTLDEKKRIKAVRYFTDMAGWVPNYVDETTEIEDR
ncbi:MAG: acireductone dioxygenase [Leptospiraceae bacterium]|nr:acireductone dioxygenase [Leptospiraceae bacterium]MCP5511103.1 acireductone dioxygenase [Leptospiraceae bacterium]